MSKKIPTNYIRKHTTIINLYNFKIVLFCTCMLHAVNIATVCKQSPATQRKGKMKWKTNNNSTAFGIDISFSIFRITFRTSLVFKLSI